MEDLENIFFSPAKIQDRQLCYFSWELASELSDYIETDYSKNNLTNSKSSRKQQQL